jgi:hypothetical protein
MKARRWEQEMFDEQKFREKLGHLLGRARYSHISTGARETLPDEIVEIVKGCEIPDKPKRSRRPKRKNTLKAVKAEEPEEESWLE